MTLETMTGNVDGLLSSLWRASWQGALAFLFLWLLCRVLARRLTADSHCWLWRLSYVKLLVGLIWSGAVLLPILSPAPSLTPLSPVQVAAPVRVQAGDTAAMVTGNALPITPATDARPRLTWQDGVAAAYLLGAAACLGRLLLAARRARHALRSAVPIASSPETDCAVGLAQRMGLRRAPFLARSMAVDGPVFLGGTVLLPADARYSESELRMILAHELAHARRRDLHWEWLGTLVQVVFYFHPLVVLARREERLAREAAADALALMATEAPAAEYGKMLLSLSLEQKERRPMLLGAVGVIEGGSLLRRRLLALRDAASRSTGRRIAVALVLLAGLVLVPWQVTRGRARASAAPTVPVAPGYPMMPPGDKQITGVVLNEKKEPVADITVGLTWHWSQSQKTGGVMRGSTLLGHVSTDAQGHFAYSKLSAGQFDLEVVSPTNRYVPVRKSLGIGETDALKSLTVVVSTGSLVSGRVVDAKTGTPLAGIFVGAGSIPPGGDLSKWDFWAMPSEATTDTQGRYQVRVMPGDDFVGIGRITNNTLASRRVRTAVQRVSVQPGQTASAPDISVSLNPIIVCVGPDGQPVANTTFRIVPEDLAHGGYILDDHTDENGTVVLNRFQSGSFSIGQNNRTASGTFRCSPDGSLVLDTSGKTTSFPNGSGAIRLDEASAGLVTGTVISEGGQPIAGARVRIVETDPRNHYALDDHVFSTDASGVFHAPLDPNGEYHAYIRADGFNQVSVSDNPLAVAKGGTKTLGTVRLVRATGTVSGRVRDGSGKPLSGVLAYVRGGKTFLSAAVTDDEGRFRIPNVVPGEALHLELCLKGETRDSGTALSQSNDEMNIPGVEASPIVREIVWHPN